MFPTDYEDFTSFQTFVSFTASSNNGDTACVGATIIDDNILETDQAFSLQLTSLSVMNVTVSAEGGMATVWITDNDGNCN